MEFNDTSWVPLALRETVIEALGRTLDWGRIMHGAALPFHQFLEASGAAEVLDLCSGAGDPAAILLRELGRVGLRAPRILMTDLTPNVEAWTRLVREHPDTLDFVSSPVDATAIPAALGAGRARVIINALHHFRPALARSVLRSACADSPGFFLVEGFERNPLRFAAFAPAGIPALLVNPVLAPRRRVAKAFLTWLTPLAFAASMWDGLVSTLRVYTEDELREMVRGFGDGFVWTYGTWRFGVVGEAYYFFGVPRVRRASSPHAS